MSLLNRATRSAFLTTWNNSVPKIINKIIPDIDFYLVLVKNKVYKIEFV